MDGLKVKKSKDGRLRQIPQVQVPVKKIRNPDRDLTLKHVGLNPIEDQIDEIPNNLAKYRFDHQFLDELTLLTVTEQPVVTGSQIKEMKAQARAKFEQAVRQVTHNGIFMVAKLLELANGVTVVEFNSKGEQNVYTRPPDFNALKLLSQYGVGSPLGEERQALMEGISMGANSQINVFIPDNGRGDAKEIVEVTRKVETWVDAKFKEEVEEQAVEPTSIVKLPSNGRV